MLQRCSPHLLLTLALGMLRERKRRFVGAAARSDKWNLASLAEQWEWNRKIASTEDTPNEMHGRRRNSTGRSSLYERRDELQFVGWWLSTRIAFTQAQAGRRTPTTAPELKLKLKLFARILFSYKQETSFEVDACAYTKWFHLWVWKANVQRCENAKTTWDAEQMRK